MISSDHTPSLFIRDAKTKILLVVIDGLGGLPHPDSSQTELEIAKLPHLDALAAVSACGCIEPLGPGFTPGSGPAHLALFGYDPWRHKIGRGALSALGLGLDFRPGDVAVRLNFCTTDGQGRVTDRRAGRIPTGVCQELCAVLNRIQIPGVDVVVSAEMEYRATVIFRGDGLVGEVTDSDPQTTGVPPRDLVAHGKDSRRMATVANAFLEQAAALLAGCEPANMVLMRGFGRYPELPQVSEVYGLRALAVAAYPMYRGVAACVGMDTVVSEPELKAEYAALVSRWADYDFAYLHIKKTDSAGEDGDFCGKVRLLEAIDRFLPLLQQLEPDVLIVTGDHSTPSILGSHSWHPVPLVLASASALPVASSTFSERGCIGGSLGIFPSTALMALALGHAQRLEKFGA